MLQPFTVLATQAERAGEHGSMDAAAAGNCGNCWAKRGLLGEASNDELRPGEW